MRGIRAGHLPDDIRCTVLAHHFINQYLTYDVLVAAFDAVATAQQKPYETEHGYADRPESSALRRTEVRSDQALAHFFVRGLAPVTRPAVAKTVQRLPGYQKTDLSTIRRIATAEGSTYRASLGMPLSDPKPIGKASKAARSNATS